MLLSVPIVDRLVDLTARAIEVLRRQGKSFALAEKAGSGPRRPDAIVLLGSEGGVERVEDVLGQIEQGRLVSADPPDCKPPVSRQ